MAKGIRTEPGEGAGDPRGGDDIEPAIAADDLPNLPWLNAVEEDDGEPSSRKATWGFTAAAVILIAALGAFFVATSLTPQGDVALDALESAEPAASKVAASAADDDVKETEGDRTTAGADSSEPVIQLASFYSKERATRYWESFQRRHTQVAKLEHSIVEGSFKGRRVHRVRAKGSTAAELCDELRRDGVPCLQVG